MFKVDNKLQAKVVCQSTEKESNLHSKSDHPNSTKKGIAYSQPLRFNKICCNRSNYKRLKVY